MNASPWGRWHSTSPTGCRLRSSVLLDLDIGMNERLCAPLEWDDLRVYDRGKIMTYDARWKRAEDFDPLSRCRR